MITTFFILIVNTFFGVLLSLLPVGSIPSGILSSLNYVVGVMNTFNWFFPLDTLFAVLLITLSYELAVVTYHFVIWLLRKIPFLNIR